LVKFWAQEAAGHFCNDHQLSGDASRFCLACFAGGRAIGARHRRGWVSAEGDRPHEHGPHADAPWPVRKRQGERSRLHGATADLAGRATQCRCGLTDHAGNPFFRALCVLLAEREGVAARIGRAHGSVSDGGVGAGETAAAGHGFRVNLRRQDSQDAGD